MKTANLRVAYVPCAGDAVFADTAFRGTVQTAKLLGLEDAKGVPATRATKRIQSADACLAVGKGTASRLHLWHTARGTDLVDVNTARLGITRVDCALVAVITGNGLSGALTLGTSVNLRTRVAVVACIIRTHVTNFDTLQILSLFGTNSVPCRCTTPRIKIADTRLAVGKGTASQLRRLHIANRTDRHVGNAPNYRVADVLGTGIAVVARRVLWNVKAALIVVACVQRTGDVVVARE